MNKTNPEAIINAPITIRIYEMNHFLENNLSFVMNAIIFYLK
jgi:hypothetical protein